MCLLILNSTTVPIYGVDCYIKNLGDFMVVGFIEISYISSYGSVDTPFCNQ